MVRGTRLNQREVSGEETATWKKAIPDFPAAAPQPQAATLAETVNRKPSLATILHPGVSGEEINDLKPIQVKAGKANLPITSRIPAAVMAAEIKPAPPQAGEAEAPEDEAKL